MVTDVYNHLQGIITRKDLMPFNVEDRLTAKVMRLKVQMEQAAHIRAENGGAALPAIVISNDTQSDNNVEIATPM